MVRVCVRASFLSADAMIVCVCVCVRVAGGFPHIRTRKNYVVGSTDCPFWSTVTLPWLPTLWKERRQNGGTWAGQLLME